MSQYKIDPMHSEISFKVKHLMISNVSGNFSNFDAGMEAAKEDFSDAKIHFDADVDSLSTHNENRDAHLKSADFFDAAHFPKMYFDSTEIKKLSEGNFELKGDLNIRGNSKPITLQVEYAGKMTDPYGNEKHGFEISGKINRKEYGLSWSAVTEAGGIVVSDDVKLAVNVQMVKAS